MPAIAHLAPRFLDGGASSSISGGAIALIICVGVIPVIILAWVVGWLLFTFPGGRTCWCTRRRKAAVEPSYSTDTSEQSFNEKPGYPLPQRPFATYRSDTGSSNGSRTFKKQHKTRGSVQSVYSSDNNSITIQEPKPFV